MNTWPNGTKKAMTQCEHKDWNANNYPGTLEICFQCDEPTGNCEEDKTLVLMVRLIATIVLNNQRLTYETNKRRT